jgi:hypothetical protein
VRAQSEYYYVDKTLLIKELLDRKAYVSLFTRPRRFGKTLNMDMLRVFFEISEEDTSRYFTDKAIWKSGAEYREHQGKYPVIFLSFKDVKFDSWEATFVKISELLQEEFGRHSELKDSGRLKDYEIDFFRKVLNGQASEVELSASLEKLSKMLKEHHSIAPIIIIDEYDTPIQEGYAKEFYDEIIGFMRNFFSGAFKDNSNLSYGFLTGILRIAQESIFSGLNNLKINSILDEQYSEYFGFTAQEVRQMAEDYHVPEKYAEICDWYDGYRFGASDIFNPWSVINYFGHACKPRAYWVSTSSNDIIGEIMTGATAELYEKLNSLLQGNTVLTYIDTDVVYPRIRENPSSVYSFLLVTGYLKLVSAELSMGDGYMCEVALPNKEIAYVYKKEILEKLDSLIPQSTAISIQEALYTGNADDLQQRLETLLLQSASYYDTAGEMFYHGLMLGLTAMMDDRYLVASNRESGEGRYDLALEPKGTALPGILIELKAERNASAEELKSLAKAALEQIDKRKYDAGLKAKGVKKVLKYGVAFSGKSVEIMVG